jgi:hypothetical protein
VAARVRPFEKEIPWDGGNVMQSRTCKPARAILLVSFLLPLFFSTTQAQEMGDTWRLVMRKLPDGTTQVPPAVIGLSSSHNGLQNVNVFWHTPEGKPASFARISTYKMSGAEYTETLLFTALDDGSGKPPVYNLTGATESTPVTREGARIAYKLPFNEPAVVIEGDKMTATLEGAFVDYWERVR